MVEFSALYVEIGWYTHVEKCWFSILSFASGDLDADDGAKQIAQLLVCQCIEQGKPSKTVAKLAAFLVDVSHITVQSERVTCVVKRKMSHTNHRSSMRFLSRDKFRISGLCLGLYYSDRRPRKRESVSKRDCTISGVIVEQSLSIYAAS